MLDLADQFTVLCYKIYYAMLHSISPANSTSMLTTVHVHFFLQKLVCVCGDQDCELCGGRWSGDLREA